MSHDLTHARPKKKIAVVACMDARLLVENILALQLGDAHVIRNAGGVVTDDTIRSLAVSQVKLGTEEVWLLHHEGCGMSNLDNTAFLNELEGMSGERPTWSPEGFGDPYQDVIDSYERIAKSPFLRNKKVRGFVFDIATQLLFEIVGLEDPKKVRTVVRVNRPETLHAAKHTPTIEGLS